MCGVDSLNGAQKCPLNICCSYFGYCGTSDIFCEGTIPATHNPGDPAIIFPCQQGFGSCQTAPVPSCKVRDQSASKGRKVAYYQSSYVYPWSLVSVHDTAKKLERLVECMSNLGRIIAWRNKPGRIGTLVS